MENTDIRFSLELESPCAFLLPLSQEARKSLALIQQSRQGSGTHLPSAVLTLGASAFAGWALFDIREWE